MREIRVNGIRMVVCPFEEADRKKLTAYWQWNRNNDSEHLVVLTPLYWSDFPKLIGLTDTFDTAKPQGWVDELVREKGSEWVQQHLWEYVWLYKPGDALGQPFNVADVVRGMSQQMWKLYEEANEPE